MAIHKKGNASDQEKHLGGNIILNAKTVIFSGKSFIKNVGKKDSHGNKNQRQTK